MPTTSVVPFPVPSATSRLAGPVRIAAARFVDRALGGGASLFRGSPRVWARPVLADLGGRLAGPPAAGGRPFAVTWAQQLEDAPDATWQLGAELLYVHLLAAADVSERTKRRLVEGTLEGMDARARVPADLDAAFAAGLAPTGVAFKLRRRSQLGFLLDAVRDWRAQPVARRRALLADPVAFGVWLEGLPCDGAQAQRAALAVLVHPDAFEPILSERVKDRIVAGFGDLVPAGVTGRDAALRAIRRALEPRLGTGFSFHDPAVSARWRPEEVPGREP